MVAAALLRVCIHNPGGLQASCSGNPFGKPNPTETKRRSQEWGVWTSSIASDLDLAADWWFLKDVLDSSSLSDTKTLCLFIFTIVATFTWIVEVYVTVAKPKQRCWDFVELFILLVEDVPQIVLTWMISGSLRNVSGLGVFNITTSLYSLTIKLARELFLNFNGCCEMKRDVEQVVEEGERDALVEDDEQSGGLAISSVNRQI